jgi:hypothetical protein
MGEALPKTPGNDNRQSGLGQSEQDDPTADQRG